MCLWLSFRKHITFLLSDGYISTKVAHRYFSTAHTPVILIGINGKKEDKSGSQQIVVAVLVVLFGDEQARKTL